MSNFIQKSFSSVDEYRNYLQDFLNNLTKTGDYNIYIHQVCSHKTFLFDTIEEKIKGIKKYGLTIDYPTICGTAAFMGNTQDIDVDKIINYSFSNKETQFSSFIFALPKYVKVDGKNVEYSSIDGKACSYSYNEQPDKLMQKYKSCCTFMPKMPTIKFCLFDTINYSEIPNCFNLGLQTIDSNGNIAFEFNTNHISCLNKTEKQIIFDKIEQDVEYVYKKYGTKNLIDLIVKAYLEYEKIVECSTDDID